MKLVEAIQVVCLSVALCCTYACSETPSAAKNQSTYAGRLRIVSLSPAISRTLVDFDLQDQIVGRSQFCWALDASIPIVGDLRTVDYEKLIRIQPTHVLLQPPATGVEPKLLELANTRGWKVGQWSPLNGVEDISQLLRELPFIIDSGESDESAKMFEYSETLLHALNAALDSGDNPLFHGRVLMLSNLEPVMAFGRDTYLHDILTRFGGENALQARGWVQLSWEDVVRMNPEAVLFVVDSPPERVTGAADALAAYHDLDIAAAKHKRLAVLAHRDALLPSSGIINVAHAMRDMLHELSEPLN